MWLRAAAATSAVAALTACSAGSPGGASRTAPTASGTSTATAISFDRPAARQDAKAALLTIADFPRRWTASTSKDSGGGGVVRTLYRCMHLPESIRHPPGAAEVDVDSSDFNAPHDRPATASETVVIGTAPAIDRDFAVVHSPKLIGCITKAFTRLIARQSARHHGPHAPDIGHPTAYRKSFASLADETDAIRLEIPVREKGFTARFYFDLVFIRDGNASVQLFFEDVFAPFDIGRALSLARLAVQRLEATATTATVASQ